MLPIALFAFVTAVPSVNDLKPEIRCAIVSSLVLQNPNPSIAQAGLLSALYWFGRIDARLTDRQTEELMDAESVAMTATDIELEAKRCGAELQIRGAAITTIGAHLSDREARRRTR